MAKCRTIWSRKATIAMLSMGLSYKDIASTVGYTYQHTEGVMDGRIHSKEAQRRISELLGISEDNHRTKK